MTVAQVEDCTTSTRDELIRRGVPVVQRIAYARSRWLPSHIEMGDLLGAGYEGLLKAVSRFDPGRDDQFENYVAICARSAMQDNGRADDSLTRYARRQANQVARATHQLRHELKRDPTMAEVAKRIGVALEVLQTVPQFVADATDLSPEALVLERERLQSLAKALEVLTPRKRWVVEQYYWGERSQADIAREIGTTESRVCQILGAVAKQLRSMLDRTPNLIPARVVECALRRARVAIKPDVVEPLPAGPRCIGERYGAWTVIGTTASRGVVLCRCDCGYRHEVRLGSMRRGDSSGCKSCAGMRAANDRKTRQRQREAALEQIYFEVEQHGHVLVDECSGAAE